MAAQEASLADVLSAQIVTLNETMGHMQRTIVQLEARISQTMDGQKQNLNVVVKN